MNASLASALENSLQILRCRLLVGSKLHSRLKVFDADQVILPVILNRVLVDLQHVHNLLLERNAGVAFVHAGLDDVVFIVGEIHHLNAERILQVADLFRNRIELRVLVLVDLPVCHETLVQSRKTLVVLAELLLKFFRIRYSRFGH